MTVDRRIIDLYNEYVHTALPRKLAKNEKPPAILDHGFLRYVSEAIALQQ